MLIDCSSQISVSVAFAGRSYPAPVSLVSGLFTLTVRKKSDVSGDRIKPMSILCRKSTGIVTDWECPSADDRGGSDRDGKNYVDLMKELRAAINTSGRDYIVTFTAPSSYWYLRHFDLKGMEAHVGWINLASYDLPGVWDSDNPIGNQVLSHTNLTEIDYALDLISVTGTLGNYLAPLTDTRTLSVLARWR